MTHTGLKTDEGSEVGSVSPFHQLRVSEPVTQWKHKIATVPEDDGITTKWWNYSANVTRSGPLAQIPAGEQIYTEESGNYIVGEPARGGGAVQIGDTLPQDGAGDDFWTGYTNRLLETNGDGAGVGVKYFQEGEGDRGGATQAGPQLYSWFYSDVAGVSNKIVPAEHWKHFPIEPGEKTNWDLLRSGALVRVPHTFYDFGSADIVMGLKTSNGLITKRVDTFSVQNDPMWASPDLHWMAATEGSNITGYIGAAHYQAGRDGVVTRLSGEGRDGGIFGSPLDISVSGQWYPVISFQLRPGWENVSLQPITYSMDVSADIYVQITIGGELGTNANFQPPNDAGGSSEYAVLVDNEATGFGTGGRGIREYFKYHQSEKNDAVDISGVLERIDLPVDVQLILMINPLTDNATFNAASLQWGGDF